MTLMLVHVGVFWAIAVGLPLGIAAAVVLLWRFRARVGWSMRETAGRGGENSAAIRPALAAAAPARPEQNLAIKVVGPNKVLTTAVATSPALAARRQLWRVALVYTGAVTVAVLITVNILRIVSPMDSSPRLLLLNSMYFAAFVPVFAPPVVLAASYVMRKQVLYLILAVLALLAVIGLWDIFKFKGGLFNLWLWYCAVPTLIALFLATRRLRAVGPIVIVGTAVWSAVSFVLISVGCLYALNFVGLHFARPDLRELSLPIAAEKYIVELSENSLTDVLAAYSTIWSGAGEGSIYTIDHPERDRKAGLVALVMILLALIVGAVAAWTAVSWLASRHRRRRASDQMFTIDVMVLIFALFIVTNFVLFLQQEQEEARGDSISNRAAITIIGLSITAFIAYKLVSATGLRLLRKFVPSGPPKTLVLLRVFGFARRSQRLLDDLGQRWRYLGPIRLIAGPDLAYATVEPDEFYDFLNRRLSRAFIKGHQDLESRLSQEAPVADPDGLYRVQDFFCHDDTWRMTVSRLAREADAVFMDLRGFSPTNRGCIFEIEQLIAWVPLDRIVLLVDTTTDTPLLEQTLTAAWQSIPGDSPNRTIETPVVRVLEASRSHWRTLNALMVMLCVPFDNVRLPAAVPAAA